MNTLPKEVDLFPPPPKIGGPEFYGASRTNYQFIGNTEDKKMDAISKTQDYRRLQTNNLVSSTKSLQERRVGGRSGGRKERRGKGNL